MRKIAASCLFLLLALSLAIGLAGCGEAKPNPADAPKAGQDNKQAVPADKVELTVSAAASLTDALKEIQTAYESKNAGIKLNFNFGASGALQQQIEQGAPADVFLSAAAKNMKALVDKQLVDAAQHKNLLVNELVVVVPEGGRAQIGTVDDLAKPEVKHVAIGEPESVPAGGYAKEALTNAKQWDALQPKLVMAKDVRQVLTYVESGNAEAGFVYKTDALTSKKVKIAFNVDPKTYKPVEYPAGIVKATKHAKEAEAFYTYLQSKEAADVFAKYGFTVPAGK
ncbi:molybdate ABC transporter substrate-binding protein [Paenibacillus ehimensis]|uniref:molybdate ABC transporter substrate-binding protein n=1 Tax=Paenibacillus ehimensis TaxID=79264 RepID=UPI000FDB013A|nr:molybdate ABC transporter substrate-binding protein [Paenibacillus ehimensis]MEC0208663.1 molybdate ABC transporter substrate-binding protein [Paenibacillus ehimensis]